jgi:hypothetical protein
MLYQLSYSRVGRQICLDTGGRVKEFGPRRVASGTDRCTVDGPALESPP